MTRIAKRTFADIKADAVHACDVVSVIDGIRKTPSGSLVVSITSPANHQRELFDLMDKSARGLVWIRVYLVPQHPLVADDP